jgi:hypothetical protein
MRRFSLKAMLLLVTAIGLFLGYSQWRRQRMLAECRELQAKGAIVLLPSGFLDYFWQRRPIGAEIHFRARRWGISSIEVTSRGIEALYKRLKEMEISVDDIHHFSDVAGADGKITVAPATDRDGVDWSLPNARDQQREVVLKRMTQQWNNPAAQP